MLESDLSFDYYGLDNDNNVCRLKNKKEKIDLIISEMKIDRKKERDSFIYNFMSNI